MKSFAISSFSALASLFLVFVNIANLSFYGSSVQAAVLPRDGIIPPANIPLDLIPKYFQLMDKCNAGGPNTYVAILNSDGTEVTYNTDVCVPRKSHEGHPVALAVVCKTVLCYIYPDDACNGGKILPLPFVPGEPFPNPADLFQILGAAVKCQAV